MFQACFMTYTRRFKAEVNRGKFALQVKKRCCTYYHAPTSTHCHATQFRCCKLKQHVAESWTGIYFFQQIFSTCDNKILLRNNALQQRVSTTRYNNALQQRVTTTRFNKDQSQVVKVKW